MSACEMKELKAVCQDATAPKLSQRFDKNAIKIAKYNIQQRLPQKRHSSEVTAVKKVNLSIYQPSI